MNNLLKYHENANTQNLHNRKSANLSKKKQIPGATKTSKVNTTL